MTKQGIVAASNCRGGSYFLFLSLNRSHEVLRFSKKRKRSVDRLFGIAEIKNQMKTK